MIWFAPRVAALPPHKDLVGVLGVLGARRNGPPMIIHSPHEMLANMDADSEHVAMQIGEDVAALPAMARIVPVIKTFEPNKVIVSLTAPEPGWILMTERWCRSWRCDVNGREVPVYGGNLFFRAVPVQAGEQTLSFAYKPFAVPFLLSLSWGTVAAVVCLSGWEKAHQKIHRRRR